MHSLRAKQNFIFQSHFPLAGWKSQENFKKCDFPHGNGSETTSTGIAASGESAFNFVAGSVKPRFTYPRAISFPSRWLAAALVIQPASFPDTEGATSFIPG